MKFVLYLLLAACLAAVAQGQCIDSEVIKCTDALSEYNLEANNEECVENNWALQEYVFCLEDACSDWRKECNTIELIEELQKTDGALGENCPDPILVCTKVDFALAIWGFTILFNTLLVVPAILIVKCKSPETVSCKTFMVGLLVCVVGVIIGAIIYTVCICQQANAAKRAKGSAEVTVAEI